MAVASTSPDTVQPPHRRWRFSIRQLLIVIAVIAVALFVYREVPEMIRRQVYNDPVPLVVSDLSKLQVRQIPNLPHNQFGYRLHLPPDQPYEVCIGCAGADEVFPEPAAVQLINQYPGHKEIEFRGRNEWIITGLISASETAPENNRVLVQTARVHHSDHPLAFEFERPRARGSTQFFRPLGIKATESFAAEQPLIVYRCFWPSGKQNGEPIRELHSPGRGLVVWIRPAAAKKTK